MSAPARTPPDAATTTGAGAPDAYGELRPRLRPQIVLGPPTRRAERIVHHAKDRGTGWFFEIGPKEHFLLSRMDGERTLSDIGAEYAEHFGRRLGPAQWNQMLTVAGGRRLLVGTDDPAAMAEIAETVRSRSRGRRTLLNARLPLAEPDRLLTAAEPRLRFLFSPWAVVPLALAALAMLVLVGTRVPAMQADLVGLWSTPALGVAALLVLWASLAVHELAHGLCCKHYGGHVPEIGVMWRFPLVAPYCKVDDVMVFPVRRHRVWTAFAGVFAGLVVLLPFALVHVLVDPASTAHRFTGAVLLMGSLTGLLNLVPFLQLDGYYMLNHALGMANLRVDGYRYLAGAVRRRIGLDDPGPPPDSYPRRVRLAYLGFAASSIAFGTALLTVLLVVWYLRISASWGTPAAVAVLAGEALVLGAIVLLVRYHRARRAAEDAAVTG